MALPKPRPSRNLGASPKEIIRDAANELSPESRRVFLKQLVSLGTLTAVTGVVLTNPKSVEAMLAAMSRFNDRVQANLFDPTKLAPTYTRAQLTQPFPFNAFYPASQAPAVNGETYKLELAGLIADKRPWGIEQLRRLPQQGQITRHICVEGWSAIGEWHGVPFAGFLNRIGADLTAKYVGFQCADGYYTSIDMPTALHPQTQLTLDFGPRVQSLPREYGYPLKLRIPTKLGFKNPKHITRISVTNRYPGGYWEDQGYNWFSGS